MELSAENHGLNAAHTVNATHAVNATHVVFQLHEAPQSSFSEHLFSLLFPCRLESTSLTSLCRSWRQCRRRCEVSELESE